MRSLYIAHYLAATKNININGQEVLHPLDKDLENEILDTLRNHLEHNEAIGDRNARDFIKYLHVECQTALGRVYFEPFT